MTLPDPLALGVVLIDDPDGDPLSRVAVSSGTTGWAEVGAEPRYEPAALVPAPPWHRLTSADATALVCSPLAGTAHPDWHVRVGRCPADWLPLLERFRDGVCSAEEARAFHDTSAAVELRAELTTRLVTWAGPDVIYHKTYARDMPRVPTLTGNHDGRLLGLHLDGYERAPGVPEVSLRRRLSINVGWTERYFLFVNFTPKQLQDRAAAAGVRLGSGVTGTDVGRAVLRAGTRYPVVRVAVRPFEFYVAPTESLIHDGAASSEAACDAHITWRGRFRIPHG